MEFDLPEKVKAVRWITHSPEDSISINFYEGKALSIKNVPETAMFVRAEIEGDGGTIYTQPFYIIHND